MTKCEVKDFIFHEKPSIKERSPIVKLSKKCFRTHYYTITKNCPFSILIKVDSQEIEFRGVIPKGFCYTLLDFIFYTRGNNSKRTSTLIKEIALICDYLLYRRLSLYTHWNMQGFNLTLYDFRRIILGVLGKLLRKNIVFSFRVILMILFINIKDMLHKTKLKRVSSISGESKCI